MFQHFRNIGFFIENTDDQEIHNAYRSSAKLNIIEKMIAEIKQNILKSEVTKIEL